MLTMFALKPTISASVSWLVGWRGGEGMLVRCVLDVCGSTERSSFFFLLLCRSEIWGALMPPFHYCRFEMFAHVCLLAGWLSSPANDAWRRGAMGT